MATEYTDPKAAGLEQRTAAIEAVLKRNGALPDGYVDGFNEMASKTFVTRNGAKMVAHAWTDPAYRQRMLDDGTAAARELGFEFPAWHQKLTVLENTDKVHNVIVCTLCSCTAYSIIGGAPGWYKEFEYRSRLVRESRTVLREMGLNIADDVELRVWDTTADTRYMVLPLQPAATGGWSADQLEAIVTQDAMIGVTHVTV